MVAPRSLVIAASSVAAQSAGRPVTAVDSSSAQAKSANPGRQRAWISGGLGSGNVALRFARRRPFRCHSAGIGAVGVRTSSVGQLFGQQRGDRAFSSAREPLPLAAFCSELWVLGWRLVVTNVRRAVHRIEPPKR